jgi:Putative beta barrel porin-7 (BBP7)
VIAMQKSLLFSMTYLLCTVGSASAQQPAPPPPPEPPAAGIDTQPAPPPQPYQPPPQPYPVPYPQPGYLVGPAPVMLMPAAPREPCLWFGMEALVWWVKNPPLPVPLLTTGPGAQGTSAGALGAPGTQSLDPHLDYGTGVGMNLNLGGWFNNDHTAGMEGSVFFLQQQTIRFGANDPSGTGQFVINEPVSGLPFTQVSAPGFATGSATVSTRSSLWGADVNGLVNLVRADGWTVNVLGGFRYVGLTETLNVSNVSTLLTTIDFTGPGGTTTALPGSTTSEFDSFRTHNDFYGGQIGTYIEYQMGPWFISSVDKLAVGVTREVVTINGNTTLLPTNAAPVFFQGGNYTSGTNIGSFGQNRFALVPEIKLNVGYQIGPQVRCWLGYDFLYWSSVLRPGNQIDNTYDWVTHPLVPMVASPFWAQGFDLGIQINF